jgi:hypothetical protein
LGTCEARIPVAQFLERGIRGGRMGRSKPRANRHQFTEPTAKAKIRGRLRRRGEVEL